MGFLKRMTRDTDMPLICWHCVRVAAGIVVGSVLVWLVVWWIIKGV